MNEAIPWCVFFLVVLLSREGTAGVTARAIHPQGALGTATADTQAPRDDTRISLFIPTFERDLCMLMYQARSLAKMDARADVVRDVHIAWVSTSPLSEYADQLDDIAAAFGRQVFVTEHRITHLTGWYIQQVACRVCAIIWSRERVPVERSRSYRRAAAPGPSTQAHMPLSVPLTRVLSFTRVCLFSLCHSCVFTGDQARGVQADADHILRGARQQGCLHATAQQDQLLRW